MTETALRLGDLPEPRGRRVLAVLLLLTACAAGTVLRVRVARIKPALTHDDGISYLAAAGNQGRYEHLRHGLSPPLASWTPAAEFKKLLRPTQPLCFGRIRDDLAASDIHPPLYFWLLHVWGLLFGTTTATGPLLNAVIALPTALALFGLVRYLLHGTLPAAAAAGIWMLSPAAVETCIEARHYDLLALVTVVFVWAALRCADTSRPVRRRYLAVLALSTAAGALTHYHFALIIAAVGLLWLARLAVLAVALRRQQPIARRHAADLLRRVAGSVVAIAVGLLLFAAGHPRFYLSLLRAGGQAVDTTELLYRLRAVLTCYSRFLVATPYNEWLVGKYFSVALALAAGAGVGLVVLAWRTGRRPAANGGLIVLYLFVTMATANFALYLGGISPRHAMAPPYLAMVWPFLAALLVVVLGQARRAGGLPMLAALVATCAAGTHSVSRYADHWRRRPGPQPFLRQARNVVVDNVARGVLPRIVWSLPDEVPVFAAPQDHLLTHPEQWQPRLGAGSVYVSDLAYGGTVERQARILELLAEVGEPTAREGGIWRCGRVWVIGEPAGDAPLARAVPAN